jgi:PAS domain S-box-containing protein
VKKKFLKLVVQSGVRDGHSLSKKRGIILSNYMALVLCLANIFLFIIIPQNHNMGGFRECVISVAIFIIPFLLNRFSLIDISRLYLCWLPPVLITWQIIAGMRASEVVPVSSYDGLRIYLVATSCIPYLLMERQRVGMFVLGVLPSLLTLLFCDTILHWFDVGYNDKGIPDVGYAFTQTRSIIAYLVVGGSCFSLKYIVDRTDALNTKLIAQLEQKNAIIQRHAESEVNQLNRQLNDSVSELSKRELILHRAQDIAEVGSWEYLVNENSVFWSDQMYEIFGLDKNVDLKNPNLLKILFGENASLIEGAYQELIVSKKSYDFTLQTKTPIGYMKWVRVTGFPLIINNTVAGMSGIVHDITRFKESEELVRSNERNYRALFEQASDAIMIIDFRHSFIDVNSSMCKLLGYYKNELLLLSINDVIDQEAKDARLIEFEKLNIGEQLFEEWPMVRKDGTRIVVEANIRIFSEGKIMAIARDITSRKLDEAEKDRVRFQLNERVKELTTLYRCSQLLQTDSKPVHEVLQDVVMTLPAGWQYPSICAARISLASMEFVTPNYGVFKDQQMAEFLTGNNLYGTVEVVYLEERPRDAEGPFLAEERSLINMIADMIRIHLSRRFEAELLKRTEANQRATINNTGFLIWSVNPEYELFSFNRPFADFFQEQFGIEAKLGVRLTDGVERMKEVRERWMARYNRALAGETFKIRSEINRKMMEYSLNPIVEDDKVIGVSVIGEDISERIRQEAEMFRVTKQVAELRLMALRSVMNPHFIFNCLNSIQYYIMENDQLNAVTYLSTFSKLIRAVLNNSVNSRVRLSEELEMIGHYVQLESLRFEKRFDCVIDVDPTLDLETIEVPSMLIQPYVENAILHGLCNKKDKGRLKLSLKMRDENLLVEIEDDGIGREAASKLKHTERKTHRSMGTALTEERLKLINADGKATVDIIDLEANGVASGTRVNVWIKV